MDERENKPSASGAERLVNCPGSWQLEQQCPKQRSDKTAESGTRIHEVAAGEQVDDLTQNEEKTADAIKELEHKVIVQWGGGDTGISHREVRAWLLDNDFNKLMSGQGDLVLIEGKRALILDDKSFRGEVAKSPKNWQLRTLAVIWWQLEDLEEISVAIIQPWVTRKPEVCVYDVEALKASHKMLLDALRDSKNKDARRTPGEWCKWCRAKTVCKEFLSEALSMVEVKPLQLSPQKIGEYLNKAPQIRKVLDELDQFALEVGAKGIEIPGFHFVEGSPRVGDAMEEFVQSYLDEHELRQADGKAKKGARALAESEWEKRFGSMIKVKEIVQKRRSWESSDEAVDALSHNLSEEKLRLVRGKLVKS